MKKDIFIDVLGYIGLGLSALGLILSGVSNDKKIDQKIEEREKRLNAKSKKES